MPKINIEFVDVYDEDEFIDHDFNLKRNKRKKSKNNIDVTREKNRNDNEQD